MRQDFGLTARTEDNFKDQLEEYKFLFGADNITYKDKNGNYILTKEDKEKIVENANQCLFESGYSNKQSKKNNP